MVFRFAVAAGLFFVLGCNSEGRSPVPHWYVPEIGIELPRLDGWDREEGAEQPDTGGRHTALRLVRKNAATGSPRIEVILDPVPERPKTLDAFLHENLRQMGQIEVESRAAGMRITQVHHEPLQLGPRRAYLVRHEFVMGAGDVQLAFTQVSTIFVVDGRGVTATAIGRTELFHPLATSIQRILRGIVVSADGVPIAVEEVSPATPSPKPAPEPKPADPIDLGTVGGK